MVMSGWQKHWVKAIVSTLGEGEYVDEGCSNNDSCTEMFDGEEYPFWDPQTSYSVCYYGKHSAYR
jgi:hypothetical protein